MIGTLINSFAPDLGAFVIREHGQSNKLLYGTVSELITEGYDFSRVYVYDAANDIIEPINTATGYNSSTFAAPLIRDHYNRDVIIYRLSEGATALAEEAGRNDWNPNTGELLTQFFNESASFTNRLAADGIKVDYDIVTVHQGERDSTFEAFANAYEANLAQVISLYQSNGLMSPNGFTGFPKKIFIDTLIGGNRTYQDEVNDAKQANARIYENMRLVDARQSTTTDDVHLDKAGFAEMGQQVLTEVIKGLSR